MLATGLSDRAVPDAAVLPRLLDDIVGPIRRLTTDGGYDTHEVYAAATAHGPRVLVPPRRDAVVSGDPALAERDARIETTAKIGRRRWRVTAGQHAQAGAESGVFRFKRVFGGRLRARGEPAQRNEGFTPCNALNRLTELGMPRSERVATA